MLVEIPAARTAVPPGTPTAAPPRPSAVDSSTEAGDASFRLGMPHLGPAGLCANWLLRECGHRHWLAIACDAGRSPGEMRDRSGKRCLASIVSAVVEGPLHLFREDADARLRLEQRPGAANGWRSVSRVESEGSSVTVTLVSAFARRRGSSNRNLVAADMPWEMRAPETVHLPREARVLRARARSFRIAAQRSVEERTGAPLESARVVAASDFNGVGLLYFANFLRLFERVEATALRGPWTLPPVVRREVHWFGNVDDGETLDLDCKPTIRGVSPETDIVTFSTVRRGGDGAVIAVCDAERR